MNLWQFETTSWSSSKRTCMFNSSWWVLMKILLLLRGQIFMTEPLPHSIRFILLWFKRKDKRMLALQHLPLIHRWHLWPRILMLRSRIRRKIILFALIGALVGTLWISVLNFMVIHWGTIPSPSLPPLLCIRFQLLVFHLIWVMALFLYLHLHGNINNSWLCWFFT